MFLGDTLFAGQDPARSLKIQLAQIYGKGRDKLEIIAPFAKSQVGGNDCVVFAIANLVEFCMGNFWQDKDSLSFRGDLYQDTLRSHCFWSSWPGLLMEGNPTRVIQLILIAAVGCRMSTTTIWFYAKDVGVVSSCVCWSGWVFSAWCGCVVNVNRKVMTSSDDRHGMYVRDSENFSSLFCCLCVCVRFHGFGSWLLKDLTMVECYLISLNITNLYKVHLQHFVFLRWYFLWCQSGSSMNCRVCQICDACIFYAIHVNCLVCHRVINVFHSLLFCFRLLTFNCYTLKMRDRYVTFCICNWRYVIGMQFFCMYSYPSGHTMQ